MLKKNNVLFFILSIFLSILVVFSSVSPISVKADNSVAEIEKTSVLDDLKDMTIDGKKFSLEDYNFDTKKNTQILSFVEYCYSFYEDKQDNFGLYIYVYNPKGLKFDTTSPLNTIQFATTKESDSAYSKYTLTFLNTSEETNYEGLFYKFKVNLSDAQKTTILNGVNSTSRVYKVSGFELLIQGDRNATEYTIGYVYKYSGYAKGYGTDENSESSLTCLKEGLTTLSLDVHPVVYRPEYANGKDEFTKDSLHSVYFSVPNEIIEEYGAMTAVHATFLNAVIKPALVTGNKAAYDTLCGYMGNPLDSSCSYGYIGDFDSSYSESGICLSSYGDLVLLPESFDFQGADVYETYLDCLYMLFFSGSELNSADKYFVSTEQIIEQLDYFYHMYGGGFVNGKYAEVMFESVDEEFTELTISAEDTFDLTSIKIDKSWWEIILGLGGTEIDYSSAFDGLKAIHAVTEDDFAGTPKEISDRLCISESSVEDFTKYYENNKENSTIYLFRYQVSDYFSQEATCFHYEDTGFPYGWQWAEKDTNAYFFQETVNLDFDVIDVTFSTEEVETTIPVVSNPVDNVGEGEPPIDTKSDKKSGCNIEDFKMFLRIIALFFILWILSVTGLLRLLIKLVVFVVTAPFKFIAWIVRKIKEKR